MGKSGFDCHSLTSFKKQTQIQAGNSEMNYKSIHEECKSVLFGHLSHPCIKGTSPSICDLKSVQIYFGAIVKDKNMTFSDIVKL